MVAGQPTHTSFTSDPNLELTVDLNRLVFVAHREKADVAREKAVRFVDHVVNHLQINQFTRIGLRQLFDRRFETQQKLDAEFANLKLTSLRAGRFFGIEAKSLANSEVAGRITDGKNGVQVRLRTETVRSQLDVPIALRDDFVDKTVEHHAMVLDIDWYTDSVVPVGVFSTKIWLEQASQVIRRDTGEFLMGGL